MNKLLIFLLLSIITDNVALGQSKACGDTTKLYEYLLSKGVAREEDQDYIRCKPIIMEQNGDGVFAFGVEETDSFTYFFILKDKKIHFINNDKIDYVFNDVSKYLMHTKVPINEKLKVYAEIIKVIEGETLNNHWLLPEN